MASLPVPRSSFVFAAARLRVFNKLLPYAFVALGSILYLLPFLRVLAWSPDEGVSEYGAQAVLHGAIPGREFIELYAPGAYYWLALFFKLFGSSIVVARGFLLAEGVVTILLVFYLARRLGGVGLFAASFVLVSSIPFAVLNTPHYDANLFALLSFAIFVTAVRRLSEGLNLRKARFLLFVSGAVAGCTSCIMQQKGAFFLAAFAISTILVRPRRLGGVLLTLFAGFILPIAGGMAFYAAHGALGDLVFANFVLPASLYIRINAVPYGFPVWAMIAPGWFASARAAAPLPVAMLLIALLMVPFLLIMALPVIAPILAYFHRRVAFRREWWPYWLTAYALWASELHRLDLGHLRNGVLLLVVLFFTLCERHGKAALQRIAVAITTCTILMGAVNAMGALARDTVIHTRRGDLLSSKSEPALDFLMSHTRPGDDVFVYPYHPIYYFLAAVHNPTRLAVYLYDPAANGLFREAVQDIDRKKVRYVLWDTGLAGENLRKIFPAYREPPPDKLIIEPYLRMHYHQIAFEDGFHILERNK